jgi:hypothetical protein
VATREAGHRAIQAFRTLEEAASASAAQLDLVLLLDVIEHVPDDITFLKGILRHPGVDGDTRFLITVPAYQSLFCSHDVFLQHYRRYDSRVLLAKTAKAGLSGLHSGTFFASLLLPRCIQVLKEMWFGAKEQEGIGAWKGGRFASAILKAILVSDFRFGFLLSKLGIRLPGLSMFLICKRSV